MALENCHPNEFIDLGIRFETEEELQLFAAVMREELEVRIGAEISNNLSSEQLAEFDEMHENNPESDLGAWLKENCPNYKEIVEDKRKELEHEVLVYKSMISGII